MKNLSENTDLYGLPLSEEAVAEAMNGKRHFKFEGNDDVGDFWVVEAPSQKSILSDIVYKADIFDLLLQLRGGLEPQNIKGIYKSQEHAENLGKELLAATGKK